MEDRIEQLLKLAVAAPSGDNCQPWRFSFVDGQLHIHNLAQQDTSLYNHAQRASLLAHGALLENLALGAPTLGLRAEIRVFPDSGDPDLVASVIFAEGERFDDPLCYWIEHRCTNRGKYVAIPLTEHQKHELFDAVAGVAGVRLHLIHEPGTVRVLAGWLANNDRLVFENRHLHRFLFDHIRWSDEEARATGDGMDIKTLELAPMDRLAFPLLRHWPLVEILNKLGLPCLIERNALKLLESSAGIAALSLDDLAPETLVRGGRAMQRFWLQATAMGLAVQPVAGLALLIQRVRSGEVSGLEAGERRRVEAVAEGLESLFACAGRSLVMCFRLGTSVPPSARSLRKECSLAR